MGIKIIRMLAIVAIVFSAMVAAGGTAAVAAQADKVTICHKPGTPAENELTVSRNALDAHLAHGDTVGQCGPVVPPPPPPIQCNDTAFSGGQGTTTYAVELGVSGPTSFDLFYDMYSIPDQLQVFYEGNLIYDTGGLVSGSNTVSVPVPAGSATTVSVTVSAPQAGTAWEFTVFCPA